MLQACLATSKACQRMHQARCCSCSGISCAMNFLSPWRPADPAPPCTCLQAEVRHMRSLVRNPDIYQSPLHGGLMDEEEAAQVARLREGLVGDADSAWSRLGRRTRGLLYGWERRD